MPWTCLPHACKRFPPSCTSRSAVPLGIYHGLRFGLDLHPHDAPRVFVEGATTRFGTLSREFHGPRAMFNAVERIVQHYATERDKTRQDLAIAQGQQRDYHARLGAEFAHEGYRLHLKELRDQLEKALSVTEKTPEHEALPTVGDLVGRIKALKEANTIESAPERSASRRAATIEESVTTRIRNRLGERPALAGEAEPVPPTHGTLFATPLPRTIKPKPLYQQRVTRDNRHATPQLSLF